MAFMGNGFLGNWSGDLNLERHNCAVAAAYQGERVEGQSNDSVLFSGCYLDVEDGVHGVWLSKELNLACLVT